MPRSAGLECQAEKLGQLAAVWRCLVLAVGGLKGSSLCVRVCVNFYPPQKLSLCRRSGASLWLLAAPVLPLPALLLPGCLAAN